MDSTEKLIYDPNIKSLHFQMKYLSTYYYNILTVDKSVQANLNNIFYAVQKEESWWLISTKEIKCRAVWSLKTRRMTETT